MALLHGRPRGILFDTYPNPPRRPPMNPATLFGLCNQLILPAWLLLVVAPGWKWTARLITAVVVPALLGIVYIALVTSQIGNISGGFGSLADVARLFENPSMLLAGWVHYLAFDLFVGSWEVRDARRLGIPHWLVIPCLALTFLLGPAGFVLYIVIRAALRRAIAIDGCATRA